jgi:hypothetical protein
MAGTEDVDGITGQDGGAISAGGGADSEMEIAVWMPAAIVEAPRIMKQPRITRIEPRTWIRPVKAKNPTYATARTATEVAAFPKSVPLIQPID